MNKQKGVVVGAAIGIIALVIGGVSWFSAAGHPNGEGSPVTAFFTADDGKTFFVDNVTKIPPFDHNGKPAYGCYVFTSDEGKTKFVGWLYRYTAEGKRRLESPRTANTADIASSQFQYLEVKKPGTGDAAWVAASDPRARQIQLPPSAPNTTAVHPD